MTNEIRDRLKSKKKRKTLQDMMAEGPCPKCGSRSVTLSLYPPEGSTPSYGMARCHAFTCEYTERFDRCA